MDISLVIKQRLNELGLDQKALAGAAHVTESYVSQLLSRRKAPPAPGRTGLYEKIGEFLKLPTGELLRLAEVQRHEVLKRRVIDAPGPLFREGRDLILRKCAQGRRDEIRRIFYKEPFGELERLVTRKLLDVAQDVARRELENEKWLRKLAQRSKRSYEEMRVAVLEFLDTDGMSVSLEGCTSFLDPILDSWDIDLQTFAIEVVLNRRLVPACVKRFAFVEQQQQEEALPPGLTRFLRDPALSGDATEQEVSFLKSLPLGNMRPNALYYYRELQNLRDPLHFTGTVRSRRAADGF